MSSKTRAVIFDLDQTLIVQRRNFAQLFTETAQAFESDLDPVSPEQFVSAFWPKAVDMWHMMIDGVVPGELSRKYAYTNALRQLEANPALAEPMRAEGERNWIDGNTLNEDSIPVLMALRDAGMKTAIITNGYKDIQWGKIRRHGLEAYVDFAICSEEARSHKPDTGIFLQTCEKLGIAPAEAIYVGDRLDNDVGGAKAAGMRGVFFGPDSTFAAQRALHPDLPAPDAHIEKLTEILNFAGVGG